MKVFGIGYNKTGTTTLGDCMQILGYRHASFSLPLLEQVALGKIDCLIQTASSFDSFADWPYPLTFEILDQAFQGSRFILTRRISPIAWFESLQSHAMRTEPRIGTQARSLAYGFPYPQLAPEVHLNLYQNHLTKVRHYFAGRPNDFLEVCWEEDACWDRLCRFLDHPVPSVQFPHANARHEGDPVRLHQNQMQLNWYRALHTGS